jgi:hypothetical protein
MSISSKRIVWGFILGLSLIWVINYVFNYAATESDLKEVTGTLEKEIVFNESLKNPCIELDFLEDHFRYTTDRFGYDAFEVFDAKRTLSKGCRVTILVDKSAYITNSIKSGLNLTEVHFYSLKFKDKYYLTLEDYNEGIKTNRWMVLIIWSIACGGYIYELWFRKVNDIRKK